MSRITEESGKTEIMKGNSLKDKMKSPKQYTMFSLRRQLLRFVMTLVILLLLIMTTFMAVIILIREK